MNPAIHVYTTGLPILLHLGMVMVLQTVICSLNRGVNLLGILLLSIFDYMFSTLLSSD